MVILVINKNNGFRYCYHYNPLFLFRYIVLFCFVLSCIIFYVYEIYGTYVMLVSFSFFCHRFPLSFGALGPILILDSDSGFDSAQE